MTISFGKEMLILTPQSKKYVIEIKARRWWYFGTHTLDAGIWCSYLESGRIGGKSGNGLRIFLGGSLKTMRGIICIDTTFCRVQADVLMKMWNRYGCPIWISNILAKAIWDDLFWEDERVKCMLLVGNPHCVILFEDPNIDGCFWLRSWGKNWSTQLASNRSNIQFDRQINNIRLVGTRSRRNGSKWAFPCGFGESWLKVGDQVQAHMPGYFTSIYEEKCFIWFCNRSWLCRVNIFLFGRKEIDTHQHKTSKLI